MLSVLRAIIRVGQKTLESGLNIIPGDSLVDAAQKAVGAAGGTS